MKKFFKSGILPFAILGLTFISVMAYAQPGNPPPPPTVPIDGGIGFLMFAGIIFGAKKIYDNYKPGNKK